MSIHRASKKHSNFERMDLPRCGGCPTGEFDSALAACRACRDILEQHGMKQSMSRAGDCYDNAMMESIWARLKKELVQHAKFKTRAQALSSIFEWIEVWHQRERSHSSLGYLSPEQFEAARRVG